MDYSWLQILSYPKDSEALALQKLFHQRQDLDSWQFTTLHLAVLDMVGRDIQDQLELTPADIDVPDACGRTALWWASQRGDVQAIHQLLEAGANPNIADKGGFTPILNVVANVAGFNDSQERCEVLLLMLTYGAKLDQHTKENWNAIFLASGHEDASVLELVLTLSCGLGINATDCMGKTPILIAAWMNEARAVKILLEQGARLDISDNFGLNAAHYAAISEDPNMIRAILKFNCTSALVAEEKEGDTPLHLAVRYHRSEVVAELVAYGVNPNITNSGGCSPLLLAAEYDTVDIAKILLSSGADVHQRDLQGETPLGTAILHAADDTVNFFLENGANKDDLTSENEWDCISIACRHAHSFDIVRTVLTLFPDVQLCNPLNNTILHFATAWKDSELLETLGGVDLSYFDVLAVNKYGKTPIDYLDDGPMVQERRSAFCKLLHKTDFQSSVICPKCGIESGRPEVGGESDDEVEFVDCMSEFPSSI